MKKKIVGLLLTTIMATSFVGCSFASVSTESTNNQSYVIEYSVAKPVEDSGHYLEMLIYGVSANTENYVIADDVQEKIDIFLVEKKKVMKRTLDLI